MTFSAAIHERGICGYLSQLGLFLVVNDKNSEFGGRKKSFPLCLGTPQEFFLNILLKLQKSISTGKEHEQVIKQVFPSSQTKVFCEYHRPRPEIVHQDSKIRERNRTQTTIKLRFPSKSFPALGPLTGAFLKSQSTRSDKTHSHCVRITSLPMRSSVTPGMGSYNDSPIA